ncbi:MAG: phosphatase PAP2 family protein [Clostridia bacterium]
MNNKLKKRTIILTIIPLILFVILAILIFTGNTLSFDNSVYNTVAKVITPTLTNITKVFTELGGTKIVIFICIALLLIPKTRLKFGMPITCSVLITAVLNVIAKHIFTRQRPTILRLIPETGFSFPSGHAMLCTAMYVMLIYLIFRYLKNTKFKVIITVMTSLFILAIGFTRIYLGVHYTTDILGGYLLGIIVATFVYYIYDKYFEKIMSIKNLQKVNRKS